MVEQVRKISMELLVMVDLIVRQNVTNTIALSLYKKFLYPFLEKKIKSKTNKINSMQTGPRIEGNIDDIGGVVGPLLQGMKGHLPKWATSLIGSNPEILKEAETMIMKYAKENPEQVKSIIGRFVKGKIAPAATEEASLPGL